LKAEFPFIQDKDIECGKVRQSSYCKEFTILIWAGNLKEPLVIPSGWGDRQWDNMEYYW